jgi:hypothetical protein
MTERRDLSEPKLNPGMLEIDGPRPSKPQSSQDQWKANEKDFQQELRRVARFVNEMPFGAASLLSSSLHFDWRIS